MLTLSVPLYRDPKPLRALPNAGEVANLEVAALLALPLMRKAPMRLAEHRIDAPKWATPNDGGYPTLMSSGIQHRACKFSKGVQCSPYKICPGLDR